MRTRESNAFHIALLPGDGIGPEVLNASLTVLDAVESRYGIAFTRETIAGGAGHYVEHGVALTEDAFARAGKADAILFGAMGWPDIRYPDGTEVAPQIDLRIRFNLYAGVTDPGDPRNALGARRPSRARDRCCDPARVDGRDVRFAWQLGFANECALDLLEQYLYVVETYGRRLSRYPLAENGSLGPKQVVTEFGYGQFPDGLAFDQAGNIWIAGVISNQILHVDPGTGAIITVLEDSDPAHVAWVEDAYQAGELDRPHMDQIRSERLRNISSIAFGGPDLRTAFIGCLLGDQIASIRLPVPGMPLSHWK